MSQRSPVRTRSAAYLVSLCAAGLWSCSSADTPAPTGESAEGTGGESSSPSGGAPQTGPDGGTGGTLAPSTGGASTGGIEAGTGGTDGAGGQPGTGGASSTTPSAGCNAPAFQETDQWIEQPLLNVGGTDRRSWIWLPENYDQARAYPLVVLLHGCGNENNNVPIQNASGEDAILVRGVTDQEDGCWTYGTEPNVTFFDAMVASVQAAACVNEDRVFAVGYSSGSWLVSRLGCERANVLRGVATVAGGNVLGGQLDCAGTVAALFVHDNNDLDNSIDGSAAVRDRLLEQNLCDAEESPLSIEPTPCVQYASCSPEAPVVWCPTSGQGHDRQDQFAAPLIWDFFSGL